MLCSDDDEIDCNNGGDVSLKINNKYAKRFEERKRKEELGRLQQTYGNGDDGYDSSSSSDEDEDDGLNMKDDKQFLRALSLIKSHDKRIYNKETVLFNDEDVKGDGEGDVKQKKDKPVYLKDYERQRVLDKGVKAFLSDDDDDDDNDDIDGSNHVKGKEGVTYVEEQARLKHDIVKNVTDGDGGDDGDDFFQVRTKSAAEKEGEENDYRNFLRENGGRLSGFDDDTDALKRYWTAPDLDDNERFLRDYILTKGWVSKDDNPTYEEVTFSKKKPDREDGEDEGNLSSLEDIDMQEQFERRHNFRYEEEGATELVNYPRQLANSVRRTDDRRKDMRKERKERKKTEKKQKVEELKRLKNLKKADILSQLQKIRDMAGPGADAILDGDIGVEALDGDFDPEEHDRHMQKMFSEDFYTALDEDGKPTWVDDNDLLNWENDNNEVVGGEYHEGHYDPVENMDADVVEPNVAKNKRKKKMTKKERKALARAKAEAEEMAGDGEQEGEEEYEEQDDMMDELYKLDYEDVIGGDMPTRFKYRQVASNDYGLTVDEVLNNDDRDLNAWVSLRKMSQYRADDEEQKEITKYRRKAHKKYNVLPFHSDNPNSKPHNITKDESDDDDYNEDGCDGSDDISSGFEEKSQKKRKSEEICSDEAAVVASARKKKKSDRALYYTLGAGSKKDRPRITDNRRVAYGLQPTAKPGEKRRKKTKKRNES